MHALAHYFLRLLFLGSVVTEVAAWKRSKARSNAMRQRAIRAACIALIKIDDTIKKILSAMGLPTCAPKLWPARPPPSQSGGEGGDWLN